jgi:hypothetical protein
LRTIFLVDESAFFFWFVNVAIFFYDYLLTFPAEVSYIWPQPISLNTTLFYLNRFISFVGNIATLIIFFSGISDSEEVR